MDDLASSLELEIVAITDLKPHPRNYRKHPNDQIEHLMESLAEHGIYRNIVVARDNTVLAGHGVIEAARRRGIKKIPIRRLDLDPLEPRALKVLAGDNGVSHLGEIDDRALTELLKEIKNTDEVGLLGTGYNEQMLANLVFVTRPESELKDFDAAAEWVGMPEYDTGQEFWRLIILFRKEIDRVKFTKEVGVQITRGKGKLTESAWWPPREKDDVKSVRFRS